jgi:D-alanyl-lipoteichoic acid acyltransferase DltB (MBOAT superfamily)
VNTAYVLSRGKALAREELPVYLILAGLAAATLVAADIALRRILSEHIKFIGFGLLVLGSGVVLDITLGRRFTLDWFREIAAARQEIRRFLLVSLELGLLTLVIRGFKIGNQAFYDGIAFLTFFGFLIHSFLPLSYRLAFFLLLSLMGIQTVFGWSSAAWLVGIGIVLISICHLRFSFSARVTLLLVAGGVLALFRVDWIHVPSLTAIWPVLGSMFMFRLIVYLYDLQHQTNPVSVSATLSYFFLLPNAVFPLFPVVDYKTFRRTYYDADDQEIYQRGIEWIFRGVVHLILYRFVYNFLVISSAEVVNASDFVRYVVSNFALYLRVSGLFHLIVGMLHLFGFHLPETHHRYFLASSFTDFWRRINIYWKDFMTKVFFYPLWFRLKKWGQTTALVLSSLLVFLATWLLHSYQWFWLRGTFPVRLMDIFFWSILGLLVVANSLYEIKYGRERTLGKLQWNLRSLAQLTLRTAATFTAICLLWSIWTSTSLSEWASLWHFAGRHTILTAGLIPVFLVLAYCWEGVPRADARKRMGAVQRAEPARTAFTRSVAVTGLSTLVILLAGKPAVYSRFGLTVQQTIRGIREDGLNKRDAALLRQGYYENLLGVERFNTQLWEVYMNRPTHWLNITHTAAVQSTGDFLSWQLRPFASIVLKGKPLHTNRWGMRDQDYEMKKPLKTYRFALLGASPSMGSGVADNETFEFLLEERLNRENSSKTPYAKYEVLNFAVDSYTQLHSLWVLEHKVFDFEPDAILYVVQASDAQASLRHYIESIQTGVDIPYDYLKDLARKAKIDRNTPRDAAEQRLTPFRAQLLSWVYTRMAEDCRQRGVQPVWIYLPMIGENTSQDDIDFQVRTAKEAGFATVTLSNWFENQKTQSLVQADWDKHPNAEGHKLIAQKLYEVLREEQKTIRLSLPASGRTTVNYTAVTPNTR